MIKANQVNKDNVVNMARNNKLQAIKGGKPVSLDDTGSYILHAAKNSGLFNKMGLSITARAVLKTIIEGLYRKKGYTSLNQTIIADMVGCRRETVCRAIQKLRDLGLIHTQTDNSITHIRYYLTDEFFNLINNKEADTSDLQHVPASGAADEAGDIQPALSHQTQVCDNKSQGCDLKSQHNINNINNYIKNSGSNFQSGELDCANSGLDENCGFYDAADEAGSSASLIHRGFSENQKSFAKGFDKNYVKNTSIEKRLRNSRDKARRLSKSSEYLEEWINSSVFRKKNADIFKKFTRSDFENYLMNEDGAAGSVNFIERFRTNYVPGKVVDERQPEKPIVEMIRSDYLNIARAWVGNKAMARKLQELQDKYNFTDEELGIESR